MSVLKPLFSVVEALLREHQQLLELATRKKDVLIQNDLEALNEIVQTEVAHIHRIERMELERQGAGRLLAVRAGVPADQLTAERVSQLAETPEERQRMTSLTDDLRTVILKLKDANDLNQILIQQSLNLIQSTVEVLTESPSVPNYGGSGQTLANNPYQQSRVSYFDSKA
ncbi:FlgN protein [Tumebacillus permanentifrigoris]|uniref:FlgN protein n=1 Tax=Tumebacillus permanentifrigoris TaxID=378543 RepID=A0A316DG25_9BACL|nr:FlgN protein [Tumebacillus permanentifrigoris]